MPEGTVWHDGPLTMAVRHGAICYLDEIVEARQDTTVVIHPLDRRPPHAAAREARTSWCARIPTSSSSSPTIPAIRAWSRISKESTKQRFAALDFGYPEASIETEIVGREAQIDGRSGGDAGQDCRAHAQLLKGHGLDEGASTRMLINAGRLIKQGVAIEPACETTLVVPLTDDVEIRKALRDTIAASIP